MTRVILFDKDGTLLNYQKIWTPYAKRVIQAFAEEFERHDIKDELAYELGLIDGEIAPNSILASGTGEMIQNHFEKYESGAADWMRKHYEASLKDILDSMELIEGSGEMLEKLQDDGFENVIVTSDSRESTEYFVKKFNLHPLIKDIVAGDDVPHRKPDIRMLHPFMERHGYDVSDMVMVGDNRSDTMLGYEEGLRTIGVLSGTCGEQDLEGADIIVESVDDLYENGEFIMGEGCK
ncbi:MAG TPA: HAD family hydrolase [Candidatus Salinicoccus stercoripullorum]|uniref:HAD family hydrolase n=1 Tax=Candidatus Salinicoccus stercoripullorum TaxID=2838756 RepID=A0A9D1QJS6_9STAP|nr:HAD family hydrolase [Candidatus Salinicoccus stercoripullorum]